MKRAKKDHPVLPDINTRGELLLSSQFYRFADDSQLIHITPHNALTLLSYLQEHKEQIEASLQDYIECSNCHRLLHVSDDCRCWSSLDDGQAVIKDVTWIEE